MTSNAQPVGTANFFYGRVTREEAEKILYDRGCQDGLFLLRESTKKMGDYVLSLCCQNSIHHYSMESQADGKVMIENGKRFAGPCELIQYHRTHRDGLLTYPTMPCDRPSGESYVVFRGISSVELEGILLEKAKELGVEGRKQDLLRGENRQYLIDAVKASLHQNQPWCHGDISRDDAERRIAKSGHQDGKYLLRYQKDKGEYRLTLSFKGEAKHYIVSHKNKLFFIENGPTFDSLIEMVDHYHNKADGLLCPLRIPCVRPNAGTGRFASDAMDAMKLPSSTGRTPSAMGFTPGRTNSSLGVRAQPGVRGGASVQQFPANKPSTQHFGKQPGRGDHTQRHPGSPIQPNSSSQGYRSQLSNSVTESVWDEPDVYHSHHQATQNGHRPGQMEVNDDTQKIYDSVPTTEASFNLPRSDLDLKDKLGAGCFGSVLKGIYKRGGQEIPVAVKTLKLDDDSGKEEIMKEARIMAKLKHRHVVRLIGICHADTIMLVLELAPLGPLNKYLKDEPTLPMPKILNLMFQVALGMRYLESQKFVHRDLAARNVLIVNDNFAKISDFGMSKALGMDGEYYKASAAGKWPLKWYAPECIYYFKFDSKSDVWSYGVTLWEATSRAGKPYQKLKGAEIIRMIDEGKRLDKPSECPVEVYGIMQQCWEYDKEDRPSFSQLSEWMKKLCR